jgi:uncharacterized protein (TIGR01244 family)
MIPVILLVMALYTNAQSPLSEFQNYVPITDNLHTCGQVTEETVSKLKEEGVQTLISLNAESEEETDRLRKGTEALGITFVHIPVSWDNPSIESLEYFFDAMNANKQTEVLVHCQLNWRASAFVYLYRTLELKEPEETAKKALNEIWNPEKYRAWKAFFRKAENHFE